MSEQLITVSEAAQKLGAASSLPSNKCLTKAEFDELVNRIGYDPDKAPNGVYIMHKNRRLFLKQYWQYPGSNASGVAVKTSNCSFVIAPEESTLYWGEYDLISGCVTITDYDTARKDYKGKQNTDAIIAQLGTDTSYAANYCRNYRFKHGVQGYLPALGEFHEALQNKAEVDACMSLIGGTPMNEDSSYQR